VRTSAGEFTDGFLTFGIGVGCGATIASFGAVAATGRVAGAESVPVSPLARAAAAAGSASASACANCAGSAFSRLVESKD